MRIGKFLFIFMLAGFGGQCFASTTAQICNSCSVGDTEALAKDTGNGDHFYYDMVGRKLTHWSITGTVPQVSNFGQHIYTSQVASITNVPITTADQSAFNATQALYDQFGTLYLTAAMTVTFAPPASDSAVSRRTVMMAGMPSPLVDANGNANAYDVVNQPANMQAAINAASDASTFDGYVMDARANISAFVNNANIFNGLIPNPTTIVEQINFPDGSYMVITYNYVARAWQFVEGSAHDSEGNTIPDTLVEVAGVNGQTSYHYAAGDKGFSDGFSQLENVQRLGASVTVEAVTNTTGWILACTSAPGAGTSCTAYPE